MQHFICEVKRDETVFMLMLGMTCGIEIAKSSTIPWFIKHIVIAFSTW